MAIQYSQDRTNNSDCRIPVLRSFGGNSEPVDCTVRKRMNEVAAPSLKRGVSVQVRQTREHEKVENGSSTNNDRKRSEEVAVKLRYRGDDAGSVSRVSEC